MTDFTAARRTMVENQLRTYDVTDQVLLAGFEAVRRELFVDPAQSQFAYLDRNVLARDGKTMLLTPMVLARMIQALELNKGEKVLVVNGAGYAAAVLAAIGVNAVAVDTDAGAARASLESSGFGAVPVLAGALTEGAKSQGPYDAIIVNGASEVEPTHLLEQLKEDGALAIVMGLGRSGRATIFKRIGNAFSHARAFDAAAPLIAGFEREAAFTF